MIKLVRTTRWQYCLKYKAYSTKTIILWPFIADSMHTTCLQLQFKMDIFKEDNHKLAVSAGFVLILLSTSIGEQVLVQYHVSDSSGTMLLDFNTKCVKEKNEHIAISEHIAYSFSLSYPQFLEKINLRPLNSVWQLFLLISYHVNNYSHFQAAERADAETAVTLLHQYKMCCIQKVSFRASR